ncbi:MAG: helix-turn-helix transcriptional regulator [Bacteroidales bacterium]|nr:helix-turn-helix transcriptional regulator [Bacteroidales bacterium]
MERINRLKVVLVEQNRTGKWLAEQLGKNEATISRWCSNAPQPSLEMLVKIVSILKVDPRTLLNGGNIYRLWQKNEKEYRRANRN